MAKPVPLCDDLKHGTVITKSNYPTFCETFNSTVDRCANLKGDGDSDPSQGKVTVDNTDYEHPVIRLTQSFLNSLSGGSGSGEETPNLPWMVDEKGRVHRAMVQIGTMQILFSVPEISVESLSTTGVQCHAGDNYLNVDLEKLSCSLDTFKYEDATHASLLMFHVNISSEEALSDGISVKDVEYYNINPVIPVWQIYTNA